MDFAGCGESAASFRDYNLSANISDGEACRRWALKNAPLDAARVGLLGYSNGGQDTTVLPAISQSAARAVGAAVVEVPGADHTYGFYSDQPAVSAAVIDAFVNFFQESL